MIGVAVSLSMFIYFFFEDVLAVFRLLVGGESKARATRRARGNSPERYTL